MQTLNVDIREVREIRLKTLVYFGCGAINRITDITTALKERGVKAVLVVTGGRSYKLTGAWDKVSAALDAAGIKFALFDKVTPNPTTVQIDAAAEAGRAIGAQAVIAIGGGSPIDAGKSAAIVLANPGRTAREIYEYKFVPTQALPLVAINSHPAQLENVCSVCSNDGQGIRLALDHLVAYGHRRIGMITFDDGSADDNLNYRSRVVAFREYLKAHSAFMTGFHVNVDDWRMETVSAVSRLMEWGVSAVFAVGENYSGAVRRAFHDLKIRIPEDISMIGFENRALNTLLDPPLTTIEQRLDLMVIEAVNILSGQLAGKCVRSVNVDSRLIKRQSVKKLD